MGCVMITSSHITSIDHHENNCNEHDNELEIIPLMIRELPNGVYGIGMNDCFCFGLGNDSNHEI